MLLLYIYVAAFIIGGILLGASLFLGGQDHDVDADHDVELDADHGVASADVDADVDADAEADANAAGEHDVHAGVDTHGLSLSDFWIPFLSIRFWVFFLCFFGITGIVLTLLALASKWGGLITAVSVGTVTGFAAAFIIQHLKRAEVGLVVSEEDFKGREARVLLPIESGTRGKVRLTVGGQTVDLIARCDGDQSVARGRVVLVIEIKGNEALVEPAPELEPSDSHTDERHGG